METGESETRREGNKVCLIDEQVTGYSNWAHSRPLRGEVESILRAGPARGGKAGRCVSSLLPWLVESKSWMC